MGEISFPQSKCWFSDSLLLEKLLLCCIAMFSMHFNFIIQAWEHMLKKQKESFIWNHICRCLQLIGGSELSLFSNGHNQIELSFQPCTRIARRQPAEKQHVGRLCSTLEQECRKRRNFPGGDSKCFTSPSCLDTAGSIRQPRINI